MPETQTPEELFKAYQHLANSVADGFHVPGLTREECRNEALVSLQKAAHSYDPSKGEFVAFARRVIGNHLKNEYNKAARDHSREITTLDQATWAVDETLSPKDAIEDLAPSPALEAERNDIRAALRQGLADLSPTQRRALELFAVGKSYAEISRETGVTLQAVRQAIDRATAQMRPFLTSRGVTAHFMPESHFEPKCEEKSKWGCATILMGGAFFLWLFWLI